MDELCGECLEGFDDILDEAMGCGLRRGVSSRRGWKMEKVGVGQVGCLWYGFEVKVWLGGEFGGGGLCSGRDGLHIGGLVGGCIGLEWQSKSWSHKAL